MEAALPQPAPVSSSSAAQRAALSINNIEVIYDHVILVLKGVSLEVPARARSSRCWAPTAPARATTLKAVSNLLRAERGDVTKGSIEFQGERVDQLTPNDLVKRGVIQVMEGRHCFAHLTIEDNLLTGAYTRKISGAEAAATSWKRSTPTSRA